MKSNNNILRKHPRAILMISLLISGVIFYQANAPTKFMSADKVTIKASYKVPLDISSPADSVAAAMFAWQEFIALTWPAKKNPDPTSSGYFRCMPDTTVKYGSTGAGGTVVWETYYHRDELYPNYPDTMQHSLPNRNATPNYLYGSDTINKANPGTKQNLFNNLDEASEISIANMYFTPLAKQADSLAKANAAAPMLAHARVKAGIMYEAKGNSTIYNYVNSNSYNNKSKRKPALRAAINRINNKFSDTVGNFNLPNGSIEIKASWRRYNAGVDNLKQFHWSVGMYYTTNGQRQLVVHNDTILLVGLHIIQKTPNVPTFVFATFEHVSNEKNGFRFFNQDQQTAQLSDTSVMPPKTYRLLPDSGVIAANRQFPIPTYIAKINQQIQKQLRSAFGQSLVWANYQLIGVQASVTNDPTALVPKQQFYLSNFATETNNTLQFFQGGLSGPGSNVPDPTAAHVFKYNPTVQKYTAHTAGGCLGCHGSQGQFKGGDFSVIAATGNTFVPEAVTPYPVLSKVSTQNSKDFPLPKSIKFAQHTFTKLNNYIDVQNLLGDFVSNNTNIGQIGPPHASFWETMPYESFITANVPGTPYKILVIGKPDSSNIIQALTGTGIAGPSGDIPRMPDASGTFNQYPSRQLVIKLLSEWIKNKCPNDTTTMHMSMSKSKK